MKKEGMGFLKKAKAIGLASMIGIAASVGAQTPDKGNIKEKSEFSIGQEKIVKVGKETFTIKTVAIGSGWGPDMPSNELWYKDQNIDLYYGISSSAGNYFKIKKIYFDPKDPNILIVEGNGEKYVETVKNGEPFMMVTEEPMTLHYKKDASGKYQKTDNLRPKYPPIQD